MTEASRCSCEPGSEENGWQERRCQLCQDKEKLERAVPASQADRSKLADELRERDELAKVKYEGTRLRNEEAHRHLHETLANTTHLTGHSTCTMCGETVTPAPAPAWTPAMSAEAYERTAAPIKTARTTTRRWMPWVLGSIALVAIVSQVGKEDSGSGGSGSTIDYATAEAVKSGCHDAVKQMLASPATAHFHGETVSAAANGGTGYIDVGLVDSQNRFGALLTSSFICNATAAGYVLDTPVLIEH